MAKIEYTTGNFDLVIDGTLNPEKNDEAIIAGIRYIVQRDGATVAYRNLFGDDAANKKRKELEYSDENASAVKSAFETAMKSYGDFTISVTEHVAGETASSRKMATAMWERAKTDAQLLRALGKPETDEAGIEACHTFLRSLRATPSES